MGAALVVGTGFSAPFELPEPDPVLSFRTARGAITAGPREAKVAWLRSGRNSGVLWPGNFRTYAEAVRLQAPRLGVDLVTRRSYPATASTYSSVDRAFSHPGTRALASGAAGVLRPMAMVAVSPMMSIQSDPPDIDDYDDFVGDDEDDEDYGPPALQGSLPADDQLAAGRAAEVLVSFEDSTRWGGAKHSLALLGEAYVEKDISSFLDAFSEDYEQDFSVLRNAINKDFEQDSDIQLDFEVLEYRSTFNTIQAQFRWLRTATLQNQAGTTSVLKGTAELLFDRHDDMRIKLITGDPPFGRRDAAFLAQVPGGDDTAGDGNTVDCDDPSYQGDFDDCDDDDGVGSGLPAVQSLSAFIVDGSSTMCVGVDDCGVYIDLEAGTVSGPVINLVPPHGPNDDIFLAFGGSFDLIPEERFIVEGLNGAEVQHCGLGASLFDIADLDLVTLQPSFPSAPSQTNMFFGVETGEGNRVLVEMLYQFNVSKMDDVLVFDYYLRDGTDPSDINPDGTDDCVHEST